MISSNSPNSPLTGKDSTTATAPSSSKLHKSLQHLAETLKQNAHPQGIEIVHGKVTVMIHVKDLSNATVKKIEALGVDILSRQNKRITGRVPITKLEELARLFEVTFIEPLRTLVSSIATTALATFHPGPNTQG